MNLARRWTSPSSATVRWLLGVLPWIVAVTIALVVWDHASRSADAELVNDGPVAFGTIVSNEHGQPQVNYTHGVVGDVVAALDAGSAHVGDEIAIVYDVDDPYHVAPRDHQPRRDLAPFIVPAVLVVAAASFAGAQWSARRQRMLVADESTVFSMLGTIHRSKLSIVPRLSLYALDSAAGERPVCTVRLADIRVDGPATPASPSRSRASRARPVWSWSDVGDDGALAARASAGRPLAIRVRRGCEPAEIREARNVRQFLTWLAVCGVCGLLVTATVTLVSMRGARVTERWVADGRRAVATIVGRNEQSVERERRRRRRHRDSRLMAAPVDYPDDYDPGQKYPAVVRTTTEISCACWPSRTTRSSRSCGRRYRPP